MSDVYTPIDKTSFTALGQVVRHARRVLLKIADRIWTVLIRAAHQRAMALSPPAA